MNIALLSPSKNPYSETFIQAHKNLLSGNVFYYYGTKGNIQLESQSQLVSKIQRLRYKVCQKLCRKPYSYTNNRSVLQSLKKNKIDVVLVEYGEHAFQLKEMLEDSKLPFVVHFHGYDASVQKTLEHCNFYEEVFKLASKIVVVSKIMGARLMQWGCPESKIIWTPCGPNLEFAKVVPFFKTQQFIAIGRFTDKKAPYYTILAFAEVVKVFPKATLVMAGQGELFNVCLNIIKYLNLEQNVKLVGVISPEVYRDYLETSIAFVQHSVTANNGDMEGTPVAVTEASLAGLPVISTQHGGIPDVIINKKTGLLVKEHDVHGMAAAMITVLEDLEFAKQLGANGKINISSHYTLVRHIEQLNLVLEEAYKNNKE
ncbi:colanic acid biosynthesis glycosyltransferase WcaL [Bizionia saleffrena]|uniref:Colanic acid biosynthesis glycosyltransferase WcaL n=1 Tax=Bizionia saleffrena TaxID=291189 RepID=A0A8H2LPR7_9FLAO|nr:glycosyltransferase [Bizionia saleffrena]TYB80171.1 colanic acid biosynthesis glycosyltransferase WcaL [Bizionia saleffrena]